ncbi:hypothetical protein SRB5_62430 [Streptomyces sp. RB5]|uniref:DUF2510 domain-containing protein n=1 Tax=Streptomyces smaragdinus TaxID=2585196 RepID=A0A7K0CRI9_9ACTN|nr:DUF2510 domain-containing protein [Streptomyces smaragdinus]MQY16051.1 hypothetical protein [Streptomyces smaragdinus]
MSDTSPSGWYPDPQRSADDPPRERRWDGEVWTDEVRAALPATFAAPPPPKRERPHPVRWLRARPFIAGIVLGALGMLVVGGGITAGVVAASDDDGGGHRPSAFDRRAPGGNKDNRDNKGNGEKGPRGEQPGPDTRGQKMPGMEDGFATDLASGIKLPVPDGWKSQSGMGASISTGEYKCPTAPDQTCLRGGVNSIPAKALEIKATTAKAVAEADIEKNAEESYGTQAYGGITSHDELKAEAVKVAGQDGYLIRWQVVTKTGDDGYVQSLAFPSPADGKTMILVRYGFDISDKAPKLTEMDTITKGIKAARLMGSGKSA